MKQLEVLTETMLDEMSVSGWWLAAIGAKRYEHSRPLPWDINTGWCDQWAERAAAIVGGEVLYLDEHGHCVLLLGGRYYDAQVPAGVDRIEDLPLARGEPRPSFAREPAAEARK